MGNSSPALILGSASPRRAALLDQAGVAYSVRTANIDEAAIVRASSSDSRGGPDIADVVRRIAMAKYESLRAEITSGPLMTADTMVACDGETLGKPQDDQDVAHMLKKMSGATLHIATAVCLGSGASDVETHLVSTMVRLRSLTNEDIATYVATGAGRDKAGGLSLQSEANHFIDEVDGCWSNVLGLPVCVATNQACSVDLCRSWR